MWNILRRIMAAPDLRNKVLFTLAMLLVFRVLAQIIVPLTPAELSRLHELFTNNSHQNLNQLINLQDIFAGGSLRTFSIVALGVYPYITATIVMQLLTPIIPALQNMQQTQGEAGRLRFSQITRIVTVPLAFLQALAQSAIYVNARVLDPATFNLFGPNWLATLAILVSLTTGTLILVWLGELITEHGIGNGISLIIFAGIVSGMPSQVRQWYLETIPKRGLPAVLS
ncbi:MAG: hypothetical protein H0U76_19980 [Ktedonobacteraceae bacterium]|nr:hypothetical protein [Ktedonobacteraceae bacterium]